MRYLRNSTVKKLENFIQSGGKVVFMGEIAGFVDAEPSDRVKDLEEKSIHIPSRHIMSFGNFCLPYRNPYFLQIDRNY